MNAMKMNEIVSLTHSLGRGSINNFDPTPKTCTKPSRQIPNFRGQYLPLELS
jgi:hypothetical protein